MNRPITTLFTLISVDGKISTGSVDERDVDKDYKIIPGVMEGMHQYYDLEKQTDRFSFNSGRCMMKIGVATAKNPIHCPDVTFVIADNSHLSEQGIINLCRNLERLIIATKNKNHPALKMKIANLTVIEYEKEIDFADLFIRLKTDFGAEGLTIQSGGTLNATLIRAGLIDKVSVVVAPCLIGGKDTSSLVDGESLKNIKDLQKICVLKLEKVEVLENSFINLNYRVLRPIEPK